MNSIKLIDGICQQFDDADINIKDIGFSSTDKKITISIPNKNKAPIYYSINSPFDNDKRQKLIDQIMTNYVARKPQAKGSFN